MSGIKPDQDHLVALAMAGCLSPAQTKEITLVLSKTGDYYQSCLDTNFYKSCLTESESENKRMRTQLDKATFMILKLEQKEKRMKWLFALLLDELPIKRDWLNPDYEKEMKFYVSEQ